MCKSARPVVRLLIHKDSPLLKGRLPINAEETERGTLATVDPVSYGALLASIGHLASLTAATQALIDAIEEASQAEASGETDPTTDEEG